MTVKGLDIVIQLLLNYGNVVKRSRSDERKVCRKEDYTTTHLSLENVKSDAKTHRNGIICSRLYTGFEIRTMSNAFKRYVGERDFG